MMTKIERLVKEEMRNIAQMTAHLSEDEYAEFCEQLGYELEEETKVARWTSLDDTGEFEE